MTSTNYLPGITDLRIFNYEYPDETLVMFSPGGRTEINVEFKLTGLNLLKDYIYDEMRDFFINIFLYKQDGGKETTVIAHNIFHCDKDLQDKTYVEFISSLSFMTEDEEDTGDFVSTFYYIDIIYSEKAPEDGSDINYIINDHNSRLLRSKLMFTCGDGNE